MNPETENALGQLWNEYYNMSGTVTACELGQMEWRHVKEALTILHEKLIILDTVLVKDESNAATNRRSQ